MANYPFSVWALASISTSHSSISRRSARNGDPMSLLEHASLPFSGHVASRNHPIWTNRDGVIRDFALCPYWLHQEFLTWAAGNHTAHVQLFYSLVGKERQAAFLLELAHHGSRQAALSCLRFGGCVTACTHFRDEYLADLQARGVIVRQSPELTVLVAPSVSLMGETVPCKSRNKSLQSQADKWREAQK